MNYTEENITEEQKIDILQFEITYRKKHHALQGSPSILDSQIEVRKEKVKFIDMKLT